MRTIVVAHPLTIDGVPCHPGQVVEVSNADADRFVAAGYAAYTDLPPTPPLTVPGMAVEDSNNRLPFMYIAGPSLPITGFTRLPAQVQQTYHDFEVATYADPVGGGPPETAWRAKHDGLFTWQMSGQIGLTEVAGREMTGELFACVMITNPAHPARAAVVGQGTWDLGAWVTDPLRYNRPVDLVPKPGSVYGFASAPVMPIKAGDHVFVYITAQSNGWTLTLGEFLAVTASVRYILTSGPSTLA